MKKLVKRFPEGYAGYLEKEKSEPELAESPTQQSPLLFTRFTDKNDSFREVEVATEEEERPRQLSNEWEMAPNVPASQKLASKTNLLTRHFSINLSTVLLMMSSFAVAVLSMYQLDMIILSPLWRKGPGVLGNNNLGSKI